MKHLSCEKAGFMSLSCESTGVTDETSKRDIYVAYVWRCSANEPVAQFSLGIVSEGVTGMARFAMETGGRCLY